MCSRGEGVEGWRKLNELNEDRQAKWQWGGGQLPLLTVVLMVEDSLERRTRPDWLTAAVM